MRRFSDLRRASDGKSSAIQTTEGIVKQMKKEVQLAQIELRLILIEPEHPHTTSEAAHDAFKSNAALQSCYKKFL